MKGFWKWFFIVLGVLVLAGIAFTVTLFFLHGGAGMGVRGSYTRGITPRIGAVGMMGGLGLLGMLFRGLIPLGVLVLAGFGVAYLVKSGKHTTPPAPVQTVPVCASCGKPLASDWNTCPYCGKAVEKPEPPQTPEK